MRAATRVVGEHVEIDAEDDAGRLSLRVEYVEGCLAVYAEPFESSEAAGDVVQGASERSLVASIDVCRLIEADLAIMSLASGESSGEASVLTYWDVRTWHAHEGTARHTETCLPSHSDSDMFTTEAEAVASVLSALECVAHVEHVRDELNTESWQDVLWSVCLEECVNEDARGRALMLALGGLKHTGKEVGTCAYVYATCVSSHAYVHMSTHQY
jgi:hypothetical protein